MTPVAVAPKRPAGTQAASAASGGSMEVVAPCLQLALFQGPDAGSPDLQPDGSPEKKKGKKAGGTLVTFP